MEKEPEGHTWESYQLQILHVPATFSRRGVHGAMQERDVGMQAKTTALKLESDIHNRYKAEKKNRNISKQGINNR